MSSWVRQRKRHRFYPPPTIGCLLLHQSLWIEDPDEEGVFCCKSCKEMFYSTRHNDQ